MTLYQTIKCGLALLAAAAFSAPAFAQTSDSTALSFTHESQADQRKFNKEVFDLRRPALWANRYVTGTSAIPLKRGESYLDGGFNGELLAPMATIALPVTSWLSFQAGVNPFVFLNMDLSYDGQVTVGKAVKPNSQWTVGATYRVIGWTTPKKDYWNYHNYGRMSALALTTYQTSEFSVSAGLGSERKPDYDPTFFFSSFGSPYPLRHYWMPSAAGMGSLQLNRHFQIATEVQVAVTPKTLTNRGEEAFSHPRLQGRTEIALRYFGRRWAGQLAFMTEGAPFSITNSSHIAPDVRVAYQIGKARN